MGCFSWFTMDTHHRIVNCDLYTVYLVDDKGNKWKENCYEGYGVFGGKDFYELLAEMNGYEFKDYGDGEGYVIHGGKKYVSNNVWEDARLIGIEMAFGEEPGGKCKYPYGNNPTLNWPAITESGEYIKGIPEMDPEQGFIKDDNEEEDWT